ncbi:hypothetical protein, partial [Salmonella enterica]|uniref:hypothetical protein n=1 Tax=Salmonella enterica TaxID=28901 RepID=UPI001F1D1642
TQTATDSRELLRPGASGNQARANHYEFRVCSKHYSGNIAFFFYLVYYFFFGFCWVCLCCS